MIYGIGTDIIEIDRVAKQVANENGFREKVFSPDEIIYCESRKAGKYQSYAVRFAAKEAFFKALGTGWRGGMAFSEIEILDNEFGKPEVFVHGEVEFFVQERKIQRMFVTLAHLKDLANAVVILEL